MNEITAFLYAHFFDCFSLLGAEIEIRTFLPKWHPSSNKPGPRRFYPCSPDGIAQAARDCYRLKDKYEVYMGVLPRFDRGGSAANVRFAHVIWAEIDAGEETRVEAEVLLRTACAKDVLPKPHRIVASGGGLHAYFHAPGSEPYGATGHEQQYRLTRLLRRIVLGVGGDAPKAHADNASTDAARILRVAGTLNHKIQGEPRPVYVVSEDMAIPRHALVTWEAHLPPLPLPPQHHYEIRGREYYNRHHQPRDENYHLLPATVAKTMMPAPDGHKHATMIEVAVAARKRGLDAGAVRYFTSQVGEVSGVPMNNPSQQRHLDGIVDWVMRTVQPDPSNGGDYKR